MMISHIFVKNFRSIVELDLSFRYDEGKAPGGYREMERLPFLEDKTGRYVPCLAIYGANAGGKTNIVLVFLVLQFILTSGIKGSFYPNKLHPELKATTIELEFVVNAVLFRYILEYDANRILREVLCVGDHPVFSIEEDSKFFTALSKAKYDADRLRDIYKVECCQADTSVQHRAFLACLGTNYRGLNRYVSAAYDFLIDLEVYGDNAITPSSAIDCAEAVFPEAKDREEFLRRVSDGIQRLDLGIHHIEYKRQKRDPEEVKRIKWAEGELPCSVSRSANDVQIDTILTYHRDVLGNSVAMNLMDESRGTQLLVGLLGMAYLCLEQGGVLMIDELDRSLHPLILAEIVRLFTDREMNKSKAQLIFTTHTTDLLDRGLLRLSEVAFVNKNLKRGTTVKRLSEFEGVRNVTDFRKRYLEGAFKGIGQPHL